MASSRPARNTDRAFYAGTGFFSLILIALVVGIAVVLFTESEKSLKTFGFLKFWTTKSWDPVQGNFGALPFIWGTLYSSLLGLIIAAPVSLGIAIFLSELCPTWLRTPLTFLTELLASVPSIVYGLWGIFVLVPVVRELQ